MNMQLRRTLYMMSSRLRGVFFVLIVVCILAMLIYTQHLVAELRKESRDIVEFYAQTIQRIASDNLSAETLSWLFENITQKTNFPLILTDAQGNPSSWKGIGVPDTARSPAALKEVQSYIDKMKHENNPVTITYGNQVLNYLYFSDSKLIKQLVYLPYVTIAGLGLLVLVAYLGFSSIKRSEQRFIWVGMAKETAHQLGTPISSLMGWLEIMKAKDMTVEKLRSMVADMQTDVKRLEKVAARFSQIGSQTDLRQQNIDPILEDVLTYFHRRLPQAGKEIRLVRNYGSIPPLDLNRDLFEWAVENLIKNAIDAVKNKKGKIEITTGTLPESEGSFIDISDNGVGIQSKSRRDIFKPGYSTKKRGWGLGLNLAKRIIEEYHQGKLFIKETQPGMGTTMRIVLK
ncbi:MAG: HAMP domain-containing histidine kinase [Calditrichaeota bacterium]|nr:HAMP domain-containing histidine kinase [Calditrichota bacterium]